MLHYSKDWCVRDLLLDDKVANTTVMPEVEQTGNLGGRAGERHNFSFINAVTDMSISFLTKHSLTLGGRIGAKL